LAVFVSANENHTTGTQDDIVTTQWPIMQRRLTLANIDHFNNCFAGAFEDELSRNPKKNFQPLLLC